MVIYLSTFNSMCIESSMGGLDKKELYNIGIEIDFFFQSELHQVVKNTYQSISIY